MVYGAIHEKGGRWFTNRNRVFEAIHNRQAGYNWLITDLEGVPRRIEERCGGGAYCWLTGEELTQIVREDDCQWIWAVLSGFEKIFPCRKS